MSMDRDQDAYEILRRAGFTVDDCRAVLRPGPRDERREQRRYEIARDVMAAMMVEPMHVGRSDGRVHTAWATTAVRAADALLAELEREDGVS